MEYAQFTVRPEAAADIPAREWILDAAMGSGRKRKASEKLRRGRMPAEGLALTATAADGRIVGTIRLWSINAGGVDALLLGPLAVDPSLKGCGVGTMLMDTALAEAKARGHHAILLVGDQTYYGRFGFTPAPGGLAMPGPFERHRFLALELEPGCLNGASGVLQPTGRRRSAMPRPRQAKAA